MGYKETYQSWLDDPYFDEKTKEELRSISGDERKLRSGFTRISNSARPACAELSEPVQTG